MMDRLLRVMDRRYFLGWRCDLSTAYTAASVRRSIPSLRSRPDT